MLQGGKPDSMGACLSCGAHSEDAYSNNSGFLKSHIADAAVPASKWPSTDVEGEELDSVALRLRLGRESPAEEYTPANGQEGIDPGASFESHPLELPESDADTVISESSTEVQTPSPTYAKTPAEDLPNAAVELGTPTRSDLLRTPAGPLESSEEVSPENGFSRSSFKRMLALDLLPPPSHRSPLRALQPDSVKRKLADLPLSKFKSPENARLGTGY